MPDNTTPSKPLLAYLPAILTSVAALITAVSGLLAVYFNYIAPTAKPISTQTHAPPPVSSAPAIPLDEDLPAHVYLNDQPAPLAKLDEPLLGQVAQPLGKVADDTAALVITTRNTAQRLDDGRWDWSIYLDATDAVLEQVSCVEYTLHQTFPSPVRTICTQDNGFKLSTNGWGTFTVKVRVLFKNGTERHLAHPLVFGQ